METRSSKRNKEKEHSKSKRKKLYIGLSIAAGIIIAAGIYWAVGVWGALEKLNPGENDTLFPSVPPDKVVEIPKWEGKERVNILLLGVDARDAQPGETARSDSMMVASLDPTTKKAHLFSILRDTYAPIEGYGKGRINSAITLGGPPLAMKTVGDLLGLDIQYFVYTDFEGFKALVDTIGGVHFDVEKNMRYKDNADGNRYDIDLEKGYQLLDGDKALQYVRFRHDAMSDYTRTERQRNFLKAVANELKSTWNILKMKEILESIQPYVRMNLTDINDIWKLGQLGMEMNMSGSAQIPPMELVKEEKIGGAEVIAIRSYDKLKEYVQEVLAKDDSLPEATDGEGGQATNEPGSSGTNSSTQ